jgi:YD repeat-containing protein
VDPNGVDLISLTLTGRTATIGASNSTLSFASSLIQFGWRPSLRVRNSNDGMELQDRTVNFWPNYQPTGNIILRGPMGDYVEETPAQWILTEKDGSRTVFDRGNWLDGMPNGASAIASTITRPDGEVLTFWYKKTPANTPGFENDVIAQMQSVTSSYGYQIKFEYDGNQQYYTPSKAIFINNAYEACDPSADTCALTRAWPTIIFQQSSEKDANGSTVKIFQDVTSPGLGTERYTWAATNLGQVISYKRPGSTADNLTTALQPEPGATTGLIMSSTKDGSSFSYTWNPTSNTEPKVHITTTDSANATTGIDINGCSAGSCWLVTSSTNPNGRTSSYAYDNGDRVTRATRPEGDYTEYAYDDRGNVLTESVVAKPGSGVATITRSASFPASCDNPITCNKPSWTRDAAGAQTDYTYDPTHGGVLTKTGPAGADGVRAQVRYSYVQRYAWVANGAGGFVHAGGPIWLLGEERTCRTSATTEAGCAAGAGDEIVTSYDYGPDSGAVGNTLLLRGVAVSADGQVQRTCYGYDPNTNRISETRARSGAASCY